MSGDNRNVRSEAGSTETSEPATLSPDGAARRQFLRKLGRASLSDEEIRERMSGNICRCGAYVNIVSAIRDAAGSG